jgi:hypothetical protein
VLELLASAPAAPDVDTLRARTRRHRRRRALTLVAVAGTILVASAGVAASLRTSSGDSLVSVSPPTPALTAAQKAWCVSTTRDEAIARALGGQDAAGNTARAKLVGWSEWQARADESAWTAPPAPLPTLVWVVEATGSLHPAFAHDATPYPWEITEIDARTRDIVAEQSGMHAPPSYFDALPDHSSECPADTAVTPTTTPAPTTTISPGFHTGPPPVPTPCPAHQAVPSMNGSFCGPVPRAGNGLGRSGECTGKETGPPCGAGMVPGRYYEYTLPGRCDGRLILDGRHWISELPPPKPVPDMDVWVSVDTTGTHAGFISPQGSVGFDPDHGQPPAACTGP